MSNAQDPRQGLAAMLTIGGERPRPDDGEEKEPSPLPSGMPEPDDEPEEKPDAEDARTVPEPLAELRERIAAESARREGLERELEFLRRGGAQPPEPQVDPVRQAMELLRIDPATWNEMIADPNRGAALATDALQKILLLNNNITRQQVLAEAQQLVNNQLQQVNIRQDGEELKRSFWEKNQALLPYERVVRQFAAEVAQEVQQGAQYTGEQVLAEINSRTRKELTSYGIRVPDEARKPAGRVASMATARERYRPAAAEMGGSLGRQAPAMSALQKQLYRLAARR
jgi:hypothetical protein